MDPPPRIPDEASGIDLTEFCGSPVRFSHEDLSFEHPNALYERIPEWDNLNLESKFFHSPDGSLSLNLLTCFAGGSFGMACHAELKGRGTIQCIVKIIQVDDDVNKRVEALKEFMIHAILTHTCSTDPYIAERQELGRMATIAKLYAGFRVKSYELDFEGGLDKTVRAEYFVFVMENAGGQTLFQQIQQGRGHPHSISSVAAFAAYQVSSLLERLGDLLQFNHRDLHDKNILVNDRNRTLSGRRMCGMTDMFTCCVIDFGYSRLTYRGRDIRCSYEKIRVAGNPEQAYNLGHDTTYFLRTLRKIICGSVVVRTPCSVAVIPELIEFLEAVMIASGLDFESNACKSTTREFIAVLTYVGNFEALQTCQGGHYANQTNVIRPYLLHPRTVKTLSASILRILGVLCFDPHNAERLAETRAAFHEALERDIGVDMNLEDISR